MKYKSLAFLYCFLFSLVVYSQISPPGLGESNTAGWFAIGLRQKLDSMNRKQSFTYVGMGRISGLDHSNPYHKSAILVINQEFYNQFHKHWQYSLALSYRRQNEYEETPPYGKSNPAYKQEFRMYGRFSHLWTSSRFKIVSTLRQEIRNFFDPEFIYESLQLRTRIREQLTINLTKKQTQSIVVSAEALFSTNTSDLKIWETFEYHESRFCLYYSLSPKKHPITYDVGYMYNIIGMSDEVHSVNYLAIDFVWKNPFNSFKKNKIREEPAINRME